MVLKKASTLFERDEDGKLIPQEVKLHIDEEDDKQLEYKDETIIITPMTRGEVKKLRIDAIIEGNKKEGDETRDIDAELILKHCVEPAYTPEEAKHMKTHFCQMLVNTIMIHSGLDIGNKPKKSKSIEEEVETKFSKN